MVKPPAKPKPEPTTPRAPVFFKKGDAVRITYDGRTVTGRVLIAAPNSRSLMLAFEAVLGSYVGLMPVYRETDTTDYRPLAGHGAVTVELQS